MEGQRGCAETDPLSTTETTFRRRDGERKVVGGGFVRRVAELSAGRTAFESSLSERCKQSELATNKIVCCYTTVCIETSALKSCSSVGRVSTLHRQRCMLSKPYEPLALLGDRIRLVHGVCGMQARRSGCVADGYGYWGVCTLRRVTELTRLNGCDL